MRHAQAGSAPGGKLFDPFNDGLEGWWIEVRPGDDVTVPKNPNSAQTSHPMAACRSDTIAHPALVPAGSGALVAWNGAASVRVADGIHAPALGHG